MPVTTFASSGLLLTSPSVRSIPSMAGCVELKISVNDYRGNSWSTYYKIRGSYQVTLDDYRS